MMIALRHVSCASLLLVGGLAVPVLAQQSQESCVTCHGSFSDARLGGPVRAYTEDVHAAKGFGCVACHGGDALDLGMTAMDPAKGYVGVPGREELLLVCGRCHSSAGFMRRYNPALRVDQVAEYRTSVHGELLLERGDERVATCVDCHPAHAVKPPSEPTSSVHPLNVAETCGRCHADRDYMQSYAISTDQHDKYLLSIHWEKLSVEGDLGAPTCNDCHGNHGASPPGVTWVGNVCGQCHSVMAELFNKSRHSQVFAMLGNPGCATCHGNHEIKPAGDEMLGIGEGSVCGMCHAPTDAGGMAAAEMRSLVDSLKFAHAVADSLLSKAENAGMEVSQAQFELSGATTALINARTGVHSFAVDHVREAVDEGVEVALSAQARGRSALGDLRFRRLGLAVSVGIILILIAGLVFKIRQLEPAKARQT
ncbi:MAG: cytochrome c3 family protein [Gemmatimonadota bacterium]|nr:MAG: cytochrome c3 family protein [Gemmatimonadota bacterium]